MCKRKSIDGWRSSVEWVQMLFFPLLLNSDHGEIYRWMYQNYAEKNKPTHWSQSGSAETFQTIAELNIPHSVGAFFSCFIFAD